MDKRFLRSLDSRIILRSLSDKTGFLIGSSTEVIGANAFRCSKVPAVPFESGAIVREIGSWAFAECSRLTEFKVPESVELVGDHCFDGCINLETIVFEGSSNLKIIGERAFRACKLHSITIPALTEEIDGSAFVNCPLIEIRVAPGNLNFKIEGTLLITSNGTEIVRYFGLDREIVIGTRVKVLGKSCFEGCNNLDRIDFAIGSELERIDRSALRGCESLSSIELPSSVTIIEESSFEGCTELESCLIAADSRLVTIGLMAFAKCASLRSFHIRSHVRQIGSNCFSGCISLYRLTFLTSESVKNVVRNRSLDDLLEGIGLTMNSSLFRIDIDNGGVELDIAGWSSVVGSEGDLHLTLVRDLQ